VSETRQGDWQTAAWWELAARTALGKCGALWCWHYPYCQGRVASTGDLRGLKGGHRELSTDLTSATEHLSIRVGEQLLWGPVASPGKTLPEGRSEESLRSHCYHWPQDRLSPLSIL
jgi:hypothetical protein